jgi:ATPase subunit of ABC transporter with duplicated ATPase domains
LQEKLKGLAEVAGPDATRINAAHAAKSLRTREDKVPGLLIAGLQKLVRDIGLAHATFQAGVDAQIDSPIREGANQELFKGLQVDVARFIQYVAASVQSIEDNARVLERSITAQATALAERHAVQEAEYRTIVSASAEQSERAAERIAMQTAFANAQAAANERLAKEQQRQGMLKVRALLLNQVSELRDQRFALRKRVAEELSGKFPSIRVTVAQSAGVQEYQDLVADALKGSGVKQGMTAERLSQVFLPSELAEVAAKNDIATLMQRTGYEEDRSKKILSALHAGGTYFAIDTAALHDCPCIELLDGETFKESTNLSTGQRCTTILPILLTQSERPLLIDQPEDNLDNAFVYETIVRALQTIKGTRQVIFVTHNPNIPVLGDAERVFVFSSDGQHSTLKQVGTVDECRDQIERILEGGREAFLKRKKRYGH